MIVYVVMDNDFPEAVFSDAVSAQKFCDDQIAVKHLSKVPHHWRYYAFELDLRKRHP